MRQKIKSGKNLFLIFIAATFLTSFAFAEDTPVKVRMTPSATEVGVGETFNVTVEVTSSGSVTVDGLAAPQIKGTQYLGQSSGRRSNSNIGYNAQGKIEYQHVNTQIYTFQYAPEVEGSLVLPPTSITVDGKPYTMPGQRINVVKESPTMMARRARAKMLEDDDTFSSDPFANIDKMEETFNQLLKQRFGGAGGFQAVPNINAQDSFVIVAEVDKTTVFKGEQITASWYLFTKAGIREIDTLKYPNLKGFWKEDIELATLLSFQPAELNGQMYNKALLASYALFPIEAGKSEIDEYRAKVTIVGGFGRAVTSTKNSTKIPILVKPLPDAPMGAVFSGAVGEFQMKSMSESTSVIAHQPFSIKVRIDGRGNAKQFELPNFELPSNVELYDIKKDSKYFKDGISFKEFEIFLIPREEGSITIPAVSTTVFNPRTEKYETLSTTPFEFRVLAGTGQQSMASTRIKKSGEDQEEVLVPLANWNPANQSQWVPNPLAFAVLFTTTGVGFVVFGLISAGYFRKPETLKESTAKRFKQLKALPGKNKWRELGVEATNLVNHVLGTICGEGGADVHIDRLIDKLPPSVRKELGTDLKSVMNRFYVLGFGPDIAVQQAVDKKDYEQDIKTLEKLMTRAIEMSSLS